MGLWPVAGRTGEATARPRSSKNSGPLPLSALIAAPLTRRKGCPVDHVEDTAADLDRDRPDHAFRHLYVPRHIAALRRRVPARLYPQSAGKFRRAEPPQSGLVGGA